MFAPDDEPLDPDDLGLVVAREFKIGAGCGADPPCVLTDPAAGAELRLSRVAVVVAACGEAGALSSPALLLR